MNSDFDTANSNYVTGINEYGLRNLILEVYNYRDRISKILTTAEDLVAETKYYYKGEDGDLYRERFKEFSANFSTLLENVKGYGDVLNKVFQDYRNKF